MEPTASWSYKKKFYMVPYEMSHVSIIISFPYSLSKDWNLLCAYISEKVMDGLTWNISRRYCKELRTFIQHQWICGTHWTLVLYEMSEVGVTENWGLPFSIKVFRAYWALYELSRVGIIRNWGLSFSIKVFGAHWALYMNCHGWVL